MNTTVCKTFTTGRQAIVKNFIFTIAIVSVVTILVSCSARRNASTTIEEEGVVINGVRWATRNADGHRTFVASPEIMGGFYTSERVQLSGGNFHLNRARDRYTLRRGPENRTGGRRPITWNPCPPGWRVPTIPEFESLIAAGSVWTTVNGVNGHLFGTAPNQLFLPAAGQFLDIYPEVRDVNEMGYYSVDVRRRAMVFCQENIGIDRLRSFTTEALAPRPRGWAYSWERSATLRGVIGVGEGEWSWDQTVEDGLHSITIFPELSLRCVAVTDDE